jgi:selenide,water dikinase
VLQPLKGIFPPTNYPDLLIGLAEPDDAAVMRINDQQAIISTMDFFPPVVDDPYAFGAIAAANALSDVYAMGGEPLMAINLVAYPDGLGLDLLTTILRGGAEKVKEAGAVIAGGHTVTDKEPKYGLAVTGTVHPAHIIPKGGAKIGDHLILTKSLGTGVITTALKRDLANPAHVEAAIASMSRLNRQASRLARQHDVHGMTDITGYSLLGHGHEMAHLGNVDFHITLASLSWLPGAHDYAAQEIFPGGTGRNRDYFNQWVLFAEHIPESLQNLLYDPQTSGGLLMAVSPQHAQALLTDLREAGETANVIGTVTAGTGKLYIAE